MRRRPNKLCTLGLAMLFLAVGRGTAAEPAPRAVLHALSERSGLSESELTPYLANCDANQQSMYFCAYRDLVAQELMLTQLVGRKRAALPGCAEAIDSKVTAMKRSSDVACAQAAQREWGGGSMESTARLICSTEATRRFAQQLSRFSRCAAGKPR